MFFAPKEIKKETGESLVYNSHRTMVSKEFTFDAAHHLFHYEGKCKSLHGHTYHLQIAVSGYLDERGMTYDFVIQTPLMWLDKAETWALADQLGAFDYVREKTLTCYNGIIGTGCGECPACHLRQKGLEKYLAERGEA